MPDGIWIPVWNGVLDLWRECLRHDMDGSRIDFILGTLEDVGEIVF